MSVNQINVNEQLILSISQETGQSTSDIMSQKAVTDEINLVKVKSLRVMNDDSEADLNIGDVEGNVLAQFKDGHIKTKNFDSRNIQFDESFSQRDEMIVSDNSLVHIILLGQSLSMGYGSSPCLPAVDSDKTFMFMQTRSQDLGYCFNISKQVYNNDQEYYDKQFYVLNPLQETHKTSSNNWESATPNEYETPCSGIAEELAICYRAMGLEDIPFKVLCTASGIGGSRITMYQPGSKILERTRRDMRHAFAVAKAQNLVYRAVVFWMLGEEDGNLQTPAEQYISYFKSMYTALQNIFDEFNLPLRMISYQTMVHEKCGYSHKTSIIPLAQVELENQLNKFRMAYPHYALPSASTGYLHLPPESSRKLGNLLGYALFNLVNGGFETLKIKESILVGTTVLLNFNREIEVDFSNLPNEYNSSNTQEIQQNYGFYPYNSGGSYCLTSIEKTSDTQIKIVCSSVPTVIYYGTKSEQSYTMRGAIREKKIQTGYNQNELYLYLPIQKITNFKSKFNF